VGGCDVSHSPRSLSRSNWALGPHAGKPTKPTVEIIAHDPNLVAVWREARRTGEDGIVWVDGFAGPTTVFPYERPAPDGKVI
jgi:hypothetical protein